MKRLLLVALAAAVLPVVGLPVAGPAAAVTPPTADQSLVVPVDPVRLLDTRSGLGAAGSGPVGPGGTLDLQVTDLALADGSRVPASATAVLLTVTATRATAGTDVRVYPTPVDDAVPVISNLNVAARGTVANSVTVRIGRDGRVRLRNEAGSVHLLADLAGYAGPFPQASAFVPRPPVRLLDTRGTGPGGGAAGAAVGPAEARRLDVRRLADGTPSGVPDDATAVVLNLTATGASASTDVRAYPDRPGGAVPEVSNLNLTRGRTVAGLVTVAVGSDGGVALRNNAGSAHLVADLAGWYVPAGSATTAAGAALHPVDPVRLLDTRTTGNRLPAGGVLDLQVAGAGAVPAAATALALNVTATGPTASTDVRVYPTAAGEVAPLVSNLNVTAGQTVPNAVLVAIGRDGSVRLRNNSGSVGLVVDLAGWYAPTGDGWDVSWPQCTALGSTTSRLPSGGAFAVVGLTRGAPFTDNECHAAQWDWASSLPAEPSVYLNLDAPGVRDSPGGRVWAEVCGSATPTSGCGEQYGRRVAAYALERIRPTPTGGRPMVWLDVEGPYAAGPFWQTGYPGAVAVNRGVLGGAVDALESAGYRVGVYSDAELRPAANDWQLIMGDYRLLQRQNWVFRAPDANAAALCTPARSATGGPVVQVQVQPGQSGQAYDVNHLC